MFSLTGAETEVYSMSEKPQATAARDRETQDELVGVLTAISVVSKRLARKLALLERRTPGERSEAEYDTGNSRYPPMPIKATPYKHQRAAYEFACSLFGLKEGGDGDGGAVCAVRQDNPAQAESDRKNTT